MVSIAGGEPLMHPQIEVIVQELIKRKKFVFLCTNALLLPKHLHKFKPSPYFRWVVHIDGLRERHDESVSKEGVFDKAVAAIKMAKAKPGSRSTPTPPSSTPTRRRPSSTCSTTSTTNSSVDDLQISPGYAYEKAPDQEHFLGVEETREMFRKAFADGRRKKWRLMHTPLFLDFLEGKVEYECTAWSIPSYSLFGWQKPCYLMSDGYVSIVQGADRDDRVGEVRPGQGPALRQLHGPLRLRALGRHRHDVVPEGRHPRPPRKLRVAGACGDSGRVQSVPESGTEQRGGTPLRPAPTGSVIMENSRPTMIT